MGKVGLDEKGQARSSVCLHGGLAFIWPIIQKYEFLDLTPIAFSLEFKKIRTKNGNYMNITINFIVDISTEKEVMKNAAERLLCLKPENIADLAKDIIKGQTRLQIAKTETSQILDIESSFLEELAANIEKEIRKVGLRLINMHIDESYLSINEQRDSIAISRIYQALLV